MADNATRAEGRGQPWNVGVPCPPQYSTCRVCGRRVRVSVHGAKRGRRLALLANLTPTTHRLPLPVCPTSYHPASRSRLPLVEHVPIDVVAAVGVAHVVTAAAVGVAARLQYGAHDSDGSAMRPPSRPCGMITAYILT